MENSYDEECFKKWEIDEERGNCMDVYGLRLSKRAMSGRDTAWGYPSRRMCPGCWQTSGKKSGEKEITNPKVGVLGKEVVQTNRIFDRRINAGYGKG